MEDSFSDEELQDKEEPYDYGLYPGPMRWATDQVPLQMANYAYQSNTSQTFLLVLNPSQCRFLDLV